MINTQDPLVPKVPVSILHVGFLFITQLLLQLTKLTLKILAVNLHLRGMNCLIILYCMHIQATIHNLCLKVATSGWLISNSIFWLQF